MFGPLHSTGVAHPTVLPALEQQVGTVMGTGMVTGEVTLEQASSMMLVRTKQAMEQSEDGGMSMLLDSDMLAM